MSRLNNKVAVITGGSTGIGLATAKTFIQEGAKVIITGRTQATLDAAVTEINNANLRAFQSDTSKLSDIDALAEFAKAEFGTIDILFANAGIAWFNSVESSDEAFFDAQFNTNVKGLFFTIQKLLPLINSNGSIILNASVVHLKGFTGSSVYTATKGAVRSLARSVAAELIPRNIRVNVVSPGPIQTPIFGKMGLDKEQTDQLTQNFAETVPMKRLGQPEEIAKTVLFLASDDASFITGEEILVGGGVGSI